LTAVKEWSADLRKTQDAQPAEIGERQRVEEALRASEQRLQDILDNSTAVVSVKDLDLRYIFANREYDCSLDIFGSSEDSRIGDILQAAAV